jgi:hypothetical protein
MKNKYPHLYEYKRRCRIISEVDEEYYEKFKNEIRREESEEMSNWTERNKLGEKEKIHKVKE